jgi:hypothetical protein
LSLLSSLPVVLLKNELEVIMKNYLILTVLFLGSLANAHEYTLSVGAGAYQDQAGNNYSLSQASFIHEDMDHDWQEVSAIYNSAGFVAETFSFGRATKNFYAGIVAGVMERPQANAVFGGQAGVKFNLFKAINIRLGGEFGFNLSSETVLIGLNF